MPNFPDTADWLKGGHITQDEPIRPFPIFSVQSFAPSCPWIPPRLLYSFLIKQLEFVFITCNAAAKVWKFPFFKSIYTINFVSSTALPLSPPLKKITLKKWSLKWSLPFISGEKQGKVKFGDPESSAHITMYSLHERIKRNAPVQICIDH